jgi:hypothetical protein
MTTNSFACSATALNSPIGIALNANSDLFVADQGNNRAVVFPSGATTATIVYGQSSLTASTVNSGGESASSLHTPYSVGVAGAAAAAAAVYIADYGNNRVLYFAPPAVSGDPRFTGFDGQSYEVHGQSGAIYNLLTFTRMNLNALFKRIDIAQGRRPHQLRAARAFGVSAYKALQAIAAAAGEGSFSGISAGALDHFHLSVKATTAWAHPGNYLGALGMLVNGNRLLVEAGPWETGFQRIGPVVSLFESADDDSDDDLMVDAGPSAMANELAQGPRSDDGAKDSGTESGQEIGGASEAEDVAPLLPREHTVFRFNSHQLAVHLPYISLVLTNSDGFVNLEQIALTDDVSHALLHIEGLLGQSAHVHHMAQNGTKDDNDVQAHVHREPRLQQLQQLQFDQADAADPARTARLLRQTLRIRSRDYAHHAADARYHIDDFYVESQDIFGTDFVENRYAEFQ